MTCRRTPFRNLNDLTQKFNLPQLRIETLTFRLGYHHFASSAMTLHPFMTMVIEYVKIAQTVAFCSS